MELKFLADANFPVPSIRVLAQQGFDVVRVTLAKQPDEDVLATAIREQRIVLTYDKDFGDQLLNSASGKPLGIILFRRIPDHLEQDGEMILQWIAENTPLIHMRITVMSNRMRSRPL